MVTIKQKLLNKIPSFIEKNQNMDDILAAMAEEFGDVVTNNSYIRQAIDIMQATAEDLDKKALGFHMVRYWDESDEELRQRILEAIPFWQFAGTLYSIVENIRRAAGVKDVQYLNYDNHLHQQMSVVYTGAGSAATITIEDGLLTTNCTGAPGDNVSYDLTNASYDTLTEVKDALNATGVYTATLLGGVTGNELSIWIQETIAQDIMTASNIGGGFIMDLVIWFDGVTYTADEVTANINNGCSKIWPSNIMPHFFLIPDVVTFIS